VRAELNKLEAENKRWVLPIHPTPHRLPIDYPSICEGSRRRTSVLESFRGVLRHVQCVPRCLDAPSQILMKFVLWPFSAFQCKGKLGSSDEVRPDHDNQMGKGGRKGRRRKRMGESCLNIVVCVETSPFASFQHTIDCPQTQLFPRGQCPKAPKFSPAEHCPNACPEKERGL